MLNELALNIDHPLVTPDSPNYRPPTWPPQADWPVIFDAAGKVVSRWSDPVWKLDPWAGKRMSLNFGDGPPRKNIPSIDKTNADLLRAVTGWWLFGPNGLQSAGGLKARFNKIRFLFVFCSQERVVASNLTRLPKVLERLPLIVPKSYSRNLLQIFHELFEGREFLGFTILDRVSIGRFASARLKHYPAQTPYIPPRIWNYQVTRLRECLDDFWAHRVQIQSCLNFCLEAYSQNDLSQLEDFVQRPFCKYSSRSAVKHAGFTYYGPFLQTAKCFGLHELLWKWMYKKAGAISVAKLTAYIVLVSRAALAYILNFSLMRVEEAWGLKLNCLRVEHDSKFGDIYFLRGRTTKTLADNNAEWITSPSVKIAIDVLQEIHSFRSACRTAKGNSKSSRRASDEYLFNFKFYPWYPRKSINVDGIRPTAPNYQTAFRLEKNFFEVEKLRITQDDLDLARLVTPTLGSEYMVGKPWPLAWHQLRRTGAVNMQASGLVSDASLQFQLKHAARSMSLYYGQNYSRVRLEEKAKSLYVVTMYELLGQRMQEVASARFVSPHGEKRKAEIVRLMSPTDLKKLGALAKGGVIGCRPVLLGICASRAPCPYGGIDNIAHCGGGYSSVHSKPCAEVLYDANRQAELELLEATLNERLAVTEINSPLKASLDAQKRSLENYRNVIRKASKE